jgi:hypothetical protein
MVQIQRGGTDPSSCCMSRTCMPSTQKHLRNDGTQTVPGSVTGDISFLPCLAIPACTISSAEHHIDSLSGHPLIPAHAANIFPVLTNNPLHTAVRAHQKSSSEHEYNSILGVTHHGQDKELRIHLQNYGEGSQFTEPKPCTQCQEAETDRCAALSQAR